MHYICVNVGNQAMDECSEQWLKVVNEETNSCWEGVDRCKAHMATWTQVHWPWWPRGDKEWNQIDADMRAQLDYVKSWEDFVKRVK